MSRTSLFTLLIMVFVRAYAQNGKVYQVFQFPKDQIPRIDGHFLDWAIVPDTMSIGLDQLIDTNYRKGANLDPKDFDIEVQVGWVNGLNRLYFFLEAEDDYWDFDDVSLGQDIFELVVDADLSGGPFIKDQNTNRDKLPISDLHFKGHGAHAQNYHIFTPALDKDWAMIWGSTWIKDFPQANVAYDYHFDQGESGKLRMEFWITPFDYVSPQGVAHSVASRLKENHLIGLSWSMLDFDGAKCESFMNLSHDFNMIHNASFLLPFRLMPLNDQFSPTQEANWEFMEIDRDMRWIQFLDRSSGNITHWKWDFGDGNTSTQQHPDHHYRTAGEWTVILTVSSPNGQSTRTKVWDVVTK